MIKSEKNYSMCQSKKRKKKKVPGRLLTSVKPFMKEVFWFILVFFRKFNQLKVCCLSSYCQSLRWGRGAFTHKFHRHFQVYAHTQKNVCKCVNRGHPMVWTSTIVFPDVHLQTHGHCVPLHFQKRSIQAWTSKCWFCAYNWPIMCFLNEKNKA